MTRPHSSTTSLFAFASLALLFGAGCGGTLGPGGSSGDSSHSNRHEDDLQPTTQCDSNADCGQGHYCQKDSCGAETGTCEAKPQACTEEYALVCGCDRQTYGNDCKAAYNGANVASQGECSSQQPDPDPDPQPDPSSCQTNADCSQGQYCKKSSCGDATGTCETKPQGCNQVDDPVCSCDGRTFSNACDAAYNGANVASQSGCSSQQPDPQPDPSSCQTNADCSQGQYCKKSSCGATTGTCEPSPQGCTDQYDPVCGCDGKTYGNACYAAAFGGVNVASQEECSSKQPAPEPGKCQSNTDCGQGEYCKKSSCGDMSGRCEVSPGACTEEYAPVCGCDGQTYGNACKAASQGVSVAYTGECHSL